MNRLSAMTLEEKIGQLICACSGDWPSLDKVVAEGGAGSVYGCLGRQGFSARAAAEMINHLQKVSMYPLLFVGEQEHGSQFNFIGGTEFPSYMAIGASRSPELAYEFGRINTAEGRAVGYNWISCPTVDVNIEPKNPIINTRSLGENPALVSDLGGESCRAVVEGKGLTCVCHCPGHGASDCDSHVRLPTITRTEEELWEVELAPYRAAIPKGTMNCIMTAHIHYSAWEPEVGLPATLSRRVLTGVMRERLGFQGIFATDGMTMKAIADNYPGGEAAIRAVEAGCDILLVSDVAGTTEALLGAVNSGRISLAHLDAAVGRILAAKEWMGLFANRLVDVEKVDGIVGRAQHKATAKRMAREAITLLRDEGLPLRANAKTLVLGNECEGLVTEIRRRNPAAMTLDSASDPQALLKAVREAEVVVFGLVTQVRAYDEESFKANEALLAQVREIAAVGTPTALVVMGNPYVVADLPETEVCLCTYSECPDSVEAAVMALYGELKPTGKLPVTIAGKYPYGFGL
jgi:beta-N-acetylhexosaminidase